MKLQKTAGQKPDGKHNILRLRRIQAAFGQPFLFFAIVKTDKDFIEIGYILESIFEIFSF